MRPKHYANPSLKTASYVERLLCAHHDGQLQLVLEIAKQRGTPPLQVTPTDGRHLEVLARSVVPRRMVEIGTLCGYSAVCLARALSEDGVLYTCEASAHHASVAREVFQELQLTSKIKVLEGQALDTLPTIEDQGPFDFVFIDGDKQNYPHYLQWAIEHVRVGGMIVADNVFLFDYIGEEHIENENLRLQAEAMRKFNQQAVEDRRLKTTFLPTGEGLLVSIILSKESPVR
jgi:caffeoyl-CoA O-methyltransferase